MAIAQISMMHHETKEDVQRSRIAAIVSPPRFRTMADLQEYLGGIPASRIRLQPLPGFATERDLFEVQDKESRICELVDGILVEKVMATFESLVGGLLISYLNWFLEEHDP